MKNLKIVIARHDDAIFDAYLKPGLDVLRTNPNVKIAEIFDEKDDSIFKKYNRGLDLLEVEEEDVFCFIHEDCKIIDPLLFQKLGYIFDNKNNVGVLGLIGTDSFPLDGGWWLCDQKHHFGHLIQGLPNGTTYHMNRGVGYKDSMTTVDGFCFFLSSQFLKDFRFDDLTYPGAYHFYDADTCLSALKAGFKVAVADILMEHKSEGPMPKSWFSSKEIFLNKWKAKNVTFPVTPSQF